MSGASNERWLWDSAMQCSALRATAEHVCKVSRVAAHVACPFVTSYARALEKLTKQHTCTVTNNRIQLYIQRYQLSRSGPHPSANSLRSYPPSANTLRALLPLARRTTARGHRRLNWIATVAVFNTCREHNIKKFVPRLPKGRRTRSAWLAFDVKLTHSK